MIRPGSVSVVFLVFSLIIVRVDSVLHPVVNTIYGPIQGFDHISADGHRAEIFLGIPYAKPPVDDLRFEKPQPPDPWPNPFQATRFSRECATYPDFMTAADEEDCLTINIIKPKVPPTDARGYPVMVFVHGGGFIIGSSGHYGYKSAADGLASKGVIVVTVNYRLGLFGFFATGTTEDEGNYAVWDIIEALKFTQKIISDFKGDPKRVTVFGESAGAALVSYLSITPHTKGLFQQVIPMSGSAGVSWAHGNKTRTTTLKVAKALGCTDTEAGGVKECVKRHSTEDIRKAMATFVTGVIDPDSLNLVFFHPIFNADLFPDSENFEDAIQKAEKRPHFIGVTSQEDALFAIQVSPRYHIGEHHPMPLSKASNLTDSGLEESITFMLKTDPRSSDSSYISRITDFYRIQSDTYTHDNKLQAYVQWFSDFAFNIPAIREARLKAAAGYPVYFYRFDFAPKFIPLVDGAPHASELSMLLDTTIKMFTYDDDQMDNYTSAKADFIELFVSFAKTGVPSLATGLSPEKVEPTRTPFVAVDAQSSLHHDLWPERVAFYDGLTENFDFDLPSGQKNSKKQAGDKEKTEL